MLPHSARHHDLARRRSVHPVVDVTFRDTEKIGKRNNIFVQTSEDKATVRVQPGDPSQLAGYILNLRLGVARTQGHSNKFACIPVHPPVVFAPKVVRIAAITLADGRPTMYTPVDQPMNVAILAAA